MSILWIVTMALRFTSQFLALSNTYCVIAKFHFSHQFLEVKWLSLTVNKFDAFKSWSTTSLKDFNGIFNYIIYRWVI